MTAYDAAATTRFTDRVADYVRWRPTYPAALLDQLREMTGVQPPASVADIGSGTGIFADLLLQAGYTVQAVEPNAAMRQAAEACLGTHAGFHSVAGTAEQTSLADQSVDLVTAAQAFHWFDLHAARTEFQRIARSPAWTALIWNSRQLASTPFLQAYERLLLEHGTDYAAVRHEQIDHARLTEFFGGPYHQVTLQQQQHLDHDGLIGRLRSTSYVPSPEHPGYPALRDAAERLFAAHAAAGCVTIVYDVQMFVGRLST